MEQQSERYELLKRFEKWLRAKAQRETSTAVKLLNGYTIQVPTCTGHYITAKQRKGHAIHQVPYYACFKPALPRLFIEQLTQQGDIVYDPFMGRGTSVLEAALLDRIPYGNDANPLSCLFVKPRLHPPTQREVEARLGQLSLDSNVNKIKYPPNLLAFYHPLTLRKLCKLKKYFQQRAAAQELDAVDDWIRLSVLTRLSGHSSGFFSRYTLPPNLTASDTTQCKINKERYLFSHEEIKQPQMLAQHLLKSKGDDPVSAWLVSQSPSGIAELQLLCSAKASKNKLQHQLTAFLNTAIENASFAAAMNFPATGMSRKARWLFARRPKGIRLHYLLRLLLLNFYSDELQELPALKERHKARDRSVTAIVKKKTVSLLKGLRPEELRLLHKAAVAAKLATGPAEANPGVPDDSVALVITSPPFLKVVDYAKENRLRLWFADIALAKGTIASKTQPQWEAWMIKVLKELRRVLRPDGYIAIEVGEVQRGSNLLEHSVVRCGVVAGLRPELIMINAHRFTKTTDLVGHQARADGKAGTNTNRVVVFSKMTDHAAAR